MHSMSMYMVHLLQDMIHIADTKVARRYGDFFIRNIHKFDEVCIFVYFSAHAFSALTLLVDGRKGIRPVKN